MGTGGGSAPCGCDWGVSGVSKPHGEPPVPAGGKTAWNFHWKRNCSSNQPPPPRAGCAPIALSVDNSNNYLSQIPPCENREAQTAACLTVIDRKVLNVFLCVVFEQF